jgi:hypothetical protein
MAMTLQLWPAWLRGLRAPAEELLRFVTASLIATCSPSRQPYRGRRSGLLVTASAGSCVQQLHNERQQGLQGVKLGSLSGDDVFDKPVHNFSVTRPSTTLWRLALAVCQIPAKSTIHLPGQGWGPMAPSAGNWCCTPWQQGHHFCSSM